MIANNSIGPFQYKSHIRVFAYLGTLKASTDPAAQRQFTDLFDFLTQLTTQTIPCRVLSQTATGIIATHYVHIHNHVFKIVEQNGLFGKSYYIDNIKLDGGNWQP